MDKSTAYRLELVEDAIAANQEPEDAEQLARLVAYKEKIMSEGVRISPTGIHYEDGTTVEFNGDGRGRARQTEESATPAQTKFISNLLNDRVVDHTLPGLGALIASFEAGTITKRSAHELIDRLMSLPVTNAKKNTASDKQVAFIEKLIAQVNEVGRPAIQAVYEGAVERGELTSKVASGMIDALLKEVKNQPKQAAPRRPEAGEVTEGMYRKGGEIFKVQRAVHGSGQLYAKKLYGDKESGWSFEYAAGAIRGLTPDDKMTLTEAKEFGALYGTCCVCARTLTNEASIEAGIGPICASKF